MAKKKLSSYEKKLQYNNAYNREVYRSFSVRLDKKKEKRLISWLEKQPSLKHYLVELVEADMPKEKKKAKK